MNKKSLIVLAISLGALYAYNAFADGNFSLKSHPSPKQGSLHFSESVLDAVVKGDVKQVASYFEKQDVSIDTQDAFGATALLHASVNSQLEIAKYLIEKEADPNLADFCGNTPLLFATVKNSTKIISLLISKGANPHTANFRKLSPISIATAHKREKLMRVFSRIEHGANIDDSFAKCSYMKDLQP